MLQEVAHKSKHLPQTVRISTFWLLFTGKNVCLQWRDFISLKLTELFPKHEDSIPVESSITSSHVSLSLGASTSLMLSLSVTFVELKLLVPAGSPALGVEQNRGLQLSRLVWDRLGEEGLSVPSPDLLTKTCTGSEWSFC